MEMLFHCIRKEMITIKAKTIYCPQCGSKVGEYDGKSTIDHRSRCNKCNKCIIYNVNTGETKIKPLPRRASSSGMVFN